jgi:hypothetical protein
VTHTMFARHLFDFCQRVMRRALVPSFGHMVGVEDVHMAIPPLA